MQGGRDVIHFDGVCPLLLCFATGPHDHQICPKCGAVAYGNIYCDECKRKVDIHRELAIIELQTRKETLEKGG